MPFAVADFGKWMQIGETFVRKSRIYYVSPLAAKLDPATHEEVAYYMIRYDYGQQMEFGAQVLNQKDLIDLADARKRVLTILLAPDIKKVEPSVVRMPEKRGFSGFAQLLMCRLKERWNQ